MTTHRKLSRPAAATLLLGALLGPGPATAQPVRLDDFENVDAWKPVVSDGAKLSLGLGEGKNGRALLMDFSLAGGYGYVIARRAVQLDLARDYRFTFDLRGDTPVNNFEFKMVDSAENVWWIKKLNVDYPRAWKRTRIKKSQIGYAWGPAGGGEAARIVAVEFVVSTGTGGAGRVWIDNFSYEPVVPPGGPFPAAAVTASDAAPGGKPRMEQGDSVLSGWVVQGPSATMEIDFGRSREIGGLQLDWAPGRHATAYTAEVSDDGKEWEEAYAVSNGNGGRDDLPTPDTDARFLRLRVTRPASRDRWDLTRLVVRGPEFSLTPNDFFAALAHDARRGIYPKYFVGKQSYWNVVGAPAAEREALVNQEGMVEIERSGFSVEPFLSTNGRLFTWNEAVTTQSLEEGSLPAPVVAWELPGWRLTVSAVDVGGGGGSILTLSYTLENKGGGDPSASLFLAVRPFQVNPPAQSLNINGGTGRIDSLAWDGGTMTVGRIPLIVSPAPAAAGVASFDEGSVQDYLERGEVPAGFSAKDRRGWAWGVMRFDLRLESGTSRSVSCVVPYDGIRTGFTPGISEQSASIYFGSSRSVNLAWWRSRLNGVGIALPSGAQDIVETIKANLGYILVNRDGPGIQPGSRSYDRSWIRDGSLTSTALLEMGITEEVRDFIDWYAGYQYPDGKIPCVVDERGGDPLPEHDSHGQYIYAVMQYFHFTGDTAFVRKHWERTVRTVRFIQSLRAQRKSEPYRSGSAEDRAKFGLVPESISHEGYWSKPMHSYWDNFFALRGIKDAATMAEIMGEKALAKEFLAERDDYRKDLYASMRLSMQTHGISYIPGCVELGDFDATSTTIGVVPGGELSRIPEPQLHATFDKYFAFCTDRAGNTVEWNNYTPYENRAIGTFVYLGQKDRAHWLMDYLMHDRRPQGWRHWGEVVWKDSTATKFVGDIPHTWVGSDFIRSVRAMFVYERESDEALVLAAALRDSWVTEENGVTVTDLPTWYGRVSYVVKADGKKARASVSGTLAPPRGKVRFVSPLSSPPKKATVNGKPAKVLKGGEVLLDRLPAVVEFTY
jgi:hypothetical protein